MKPTLSPICGPAGSGGAGGAGGIFGASATGGATKCPFSILASILASTTTVRFDFRNRRHNTGSGTGSGAGGGGGAGGAVMRTIFSSTGAGWADTARAWAEAGGDFGTRFEDFLLQPLGADFIQRAGRDFGGGNAQRLGPGENVLVLQAEFL